MRELNRGLYQAENYNTVHDVKSMNGIFLELSYPHTNRQRRSVAYPTPIHGVRKDKEHLYGQLFNIYQSVVIRIEYFSNEKKIHV